MKRKPSGAEHRRRSRAAKERARREEVRRRSLLPVGGDHLADYRALGAPPLDDPTRGLVFAQNAMLVALAEVISDPVLEAPDRWKLIAQFGMGIGTTHARALVQHKLDRVTKVLVGKADPAGGTVPLVIVPARGTPLRAAWEARGETFAPGAVGAPLSSRAYASMLSREASAEDPIDEEDNDATQ